MLQEECEVRDSRRGGRQGAQGPDREHQSHVPQLADQDETAVAEQFARDVADHVQLVVADAAAAAAAAAAVQPQDHGHPVRGRRLPLHGARAHRRGRHHLHLLPRDAHQVPRVAAGEAVQRQHPDRAGLAEAALLHRPRRRHVPAHPQLHAQLAAAAAGHFQRHRPAARGGPLLRHRPYGEAAGAAAQGAPEESSGGGGGGSGGGEPAGAGRRQGPRRGRRGRRGRLRRRPGLLPQQRRAAAGPALRVRRAARLPGPRRAHRALRRARRPRRGVPRDVAGADGRAVWRRVERARRAPRHPLPAQRLLQAQLGAGHHAAAQPRLQRRRQHRRRRRGPAVLRVPLRPAGAPALGPRRLLPASAVTDSQTAAVGSAPRRHALESRAPFGDQSLLYSSFNTHLTFLHTV